MSKIKKNKKHVLRAVIVSLFAVLVLAAALAANVSAADSATGNRITIGSTTYQITNIKTLVDADLALLKCRATGQEDIVNIEGTFEGETVTGFDAVYDKIYDMLLESFDTQADKSVVYYDISKSNEGLNDQYRPTECPTLSTSTSTVLWKITGDVDLSAQKPISNKGRIIIIAENSATITMTSGTNDEGEATIGQFLLQTKSGDSTPTLVIQGRSSKKKITVTSDGENRDGSDAIRVSSGSLYLQYTDLKGFTFKSGSVIELPSSETADRARYLYMSNSTMQDISATEAPGIFCKAYTTLKDTNGNIVTTNVSKSGVYLYDSKFSNCVTSSGDKDTAGGSAIRSYAADMCTLEARKCRFEGNRVGGVIEPTTSAQNGTSSGGGAIYWKSVSGRATLIDCDFVGNTSTVVGGAIYNTGQMTIKKCRFNGNKALKNGGAIAAETPYTSNDYSSIDLTNPIIGSLTLDADTKLIGNEAMVDGGAIYFNVKKNSIGSSDIEKYRMTLTVNGAELRDNIAGRNGGGVAIYLDYGSNAGYEYTSGVTINSGSLITGNTATGKGGAIYITSAADCNCANTNGVTMEGGTLSGNTATDGGAIYIATGNAEAQMNYTMNGGDVTDNTATGNGGAVYIAGGSFIITNGTVSGNEAKENGGAAYVAGGNVEISGGTISSNEAKENGGAVCVNNGNVTMKGGTVSGNEAMNGKGGAFYVSSETSDVSVTVTSGEISGNSAKGNGGAIAVQGAEGKTVIVTIGIHALHEYSEEVCSHTNDDKNNMLCCDHDGDEEHDMLCPVIKNNTTKGEGGAIHISGTLTTELSIYCLTEEGNRGGGLAAGSDKTTLSDFLKVDGGKVIISSAETHDENCENFNYGKSDISGSVHITGGEVDIYGSMENPIFRNPITVDIKKSGDHYVDHRKNIGENRYYNVHYFENFVVDGVESGQYTAYQVKHGGTHTVVGVIYSHPGYNISGWNTDKTAEELNGNWYYPSDILEFPDENDKFPDGYNENTYTIILYAIWDKNVYTIHFDANVPPETLVSGTMADMTASCADKVTLIPNQFVRAGYVFLGWARDKNASAAEFADKAEIENPLTTTAGETVPLYAVWVVCEHKDHTKYEYSKDGDDTLVCTCECTYYVTATIKGNPGVYTPNTQRPASIVFGASNPTDVGETRAFTHVDVKVGEKTLEEIANEMIRYAKKGGGDAYSDLDENAFPENAGTYKASLTFAEQEIFVIYEIDKAQQTAPSNKPTFVVNENKLTVDEASDEDKFGESGNGIAYLIIYYENDVLKEVSINGNEFDEFKKEWTAYYVCAYYPGNNNYEDSPYKISDYAYIYEGNIIVNIINPDGVVSIITARNDGHEGFMITLIVNDTKYYISQDYDITDIIKNDITADIIYEKVKNGENCAFNVKIVTNDSVGEIILKVSGSKLIPVISSSVAPREEFGEVENQTTTIANDSAFTSYFTIKYYDSEAYASPELLFNQTLPEGTTVIMVDKTNGTTYWYVKLESATKRVGLSSFKRMGIGTDYIVPALGGENVLKYQFIVDFSDADELIPASNIEASLSASKIDAYARAFDEIANNGVKVELKAVDSPNIELEKDASGANLRDTVVVTLPQSSGIASKWEDLNYSLVLAPQNTQALPPDAMLEVIETINGRVQTTTYPLSEMGAFIVSVNRNSRTVVFKLKSEIAVAGNYEFSVKLYAAYIDGAPVNNILLDEMSTYDVELSLSTAETPSAKIESAQKVCIKGDNTILLTVCLDLAGYTDYDILLMREGKNGYSNTAWHYEKNEMLPTPNDILRVEISLGGQDKGNYCVMVIIKNSENTTILSVPYYFVIIE